MADTMNNKPKLQLRSGISVNGGDKSPSPATKLLINHGKPNFTIARSPKAEENNNAEPLANANNNYNPYKSAGFVVKSTMFNGAFQPTMVNLPKGENEASKVVLRRAKVPELTKVEGEDDTVPEFIRRQRRIQERLAKDNLDFENRRSGYFTHVMISPNSSNRPTSFMETMSSPAVVPALEIPAPVSTEKSMQQTEMVAAVPAMATVEEINNNELVASKNIEQQAEEKPKPEPELEVQMQQTSAATNGHVNEPEQQLMQPEEPTEQIVPEVKQHKEEEFDSAKIDEAIEEVNRAVAGEDDDKSQEEQAATAVEAAVAVESALSTAAEIVAEKKEVEEKHATETAMVAAVVTSMPLSDSAEEEHSGAAAAVAEQTQENGHATENEQSQQNGHHEPAQSNGHAETNGHAATNGSSDIVISHTNGIADGPSIPSPDPSGALGVNYEPKTVVSFSKEMGSEVNKYPDTVKVLKEGGAATPVDEEMQKLAQLKFEIKTDDNDVQVTPVLSKQ